MSCGVGCKHGLDLTLLWLWHSPVATALIRPLAWEPPCATGAALEKAKRHTHTQNKINVCVLGTGRRGGNLEKQWGSEEIQ